MDLFKTLIELGKNYGLDKNIRDNGKLEETVKNFGYKELDEMLKYFIEKDYPKQYKSLVEEMLSILDKSSKKNEECERTSSVEPKSTQDNNPIKTTEVETTKSVADGLREYYCNMTKSKIKDDFKKYLISVMKPKELGGILKYSEDNVGDEIRLNGQISLISHKDFTKFYDLTNEDLYDIALSLKNECDFASVMLTKTNTGNSSMSKFINIYIGL